MLVGLLAAKGVSLQRPGWVRITLRTQVIARLILSAYHTIYKQSLFPSASLPDGQIKQLIKLKHRRQ